MKDYLGQELNIGDSIVYMRSSRLCNYFRRGTVVGMTKCFVIVNKTKVSPEKTIKINDIKLPEVEEPQLNNESLENI